MSEEWKSKLAQKGMTRDGILPNEEYEGLKQRLLSFGGEAAIIHYEADVTKILERGFVAMGDGAKLLEGTQNQCHGNSGANFIKHGLRIVSGYALSQDGAWRQHTWNLDRTSAEVIETTEMRLAYFGFELDQKEAKDFAEANPLDEYIELPSVDLVLIENPVANRVVRTAEGRLGVKVKYEFPLDFHINRLWMLELVDDSYYLRLSLDELDFDDDEEAELNAEFVGDEVLEFSPPMLIEHDGLLAQIASLRSNCSILTVPDESDEYYCLMQMAANQYNLVEENLEST